MKYTDKQYNALRVFGIIIIVIECLIYNYR